MACANFNPRNAVRRALLDDRGSSQAQRFAPAPGLTASKAPAASSGRASARAALSKNERPPIDPDAT